MMATLLIAAVALAIIVVYALASFGLVLRTGRWRWVRVGLMAAYLVVGPVLWMVVLFAVNWGVGYVVLGVRAMSE